MTQLALVQVAAARALTDNQRVAWQLIRSVPGGVTADEIGAAIHAANGRHADDVRCEWCARTGMQTARSVALRPLVVRRHGGMYQPRRKEDQASAAAASSQTDTLPGETFADIFGDAA